jgi:hypothetical protein
MGYDVRQPVRFVRQAPHLSIDIHPANFPIMFIDPEQGAHAAKDIHLAMRAFMMGGSLALEYVC